MAKSEKPNPSNNYAKYTGIATQLIVVLFISLWIGKKIDEKLGGENQYFTALLMISVLVAYFYKLYKELESERKK